MLVEGSQQFDDPGSEGPAPGQVRVLDDATDPAQPVSSRSILTVFGTSILGAGAGLALGAFAHQAELEKEALALHEKDPQKAKEFLTDYCLDVANKSVDRYWKLAEELWSKYHTLF